MWSLRWSVHRRQHHARRPLSGMLAASPAGRALRTPTTPRAALMSDDVAGLLGVLASALVWATVRLLTQSEPEKQQQRACPECDHEG